MSTGLAKLAKLADEARKAFEAMSPAERQEGYDMLARVAENARLRARWRR